MCGSTMWRGRVGCNQVWCRARRRSLIRSLEWSLGTSILRAWIVGFRTMNTMKLILFLYYLVRCIGQDIFHCEAIELGQVFVEFSIREESLTESIDCCFCCRMVCRPSLYWTVPHSLKVILYVAAGCDKGHQTASLTSFYSRTAPRRCLWAGRIRKWNCWLGLCTTRELDLGG